LKEDEATIGNRLSGVYNRGFQKSGKKKAQ